MNLGSNKMDIAQVQERLSTKRIGRKIMHYQTIDSTNNELKRLMNEGVEEGTAAVAEVQSAGKGRLDRVWYSPEGGLWFSVILKPRTLSNEKLPIISLMVGEAVAETLREQFSMEVNLKWPNDIIVKNRKLGGILTESVFSGNELEGVIVGIGLNITQKSNEFNSDIQKTAISLIEALDETSHISREKILAGILNKLEIQYAILEERNEVVILNKWTELSTTIGGPVLVELENNKEIKGKAVGLDSNGALIVVDNYGIKHKIIAGDCIHLFESE